MPTHTQNTSDGETRGCAHTTRSPSRGHETRATQVHITINIARQPVVMRGFCSLSTPRTSHCVHAAHPIHRAFASRRLVRTRAITRTSVFAPQQVRAHRTQQTRTHTNTHLHRTHALAHVSLPNHAASKSTGDGALWQRHQSASIGTNRHTSLCAHTSVTRQSDGCWVAWAWWQFRPRGRRHASTGGRELSHARCLHPTRAHHACIHPSLAPSRIHNLIACPSLPFHAAHDGTRWQGTTGRQGTTKRVALFMREGRTQTHLLVTCLVPLCMLEHTVPAGPLAGAATSGRRTCRRAPPVGAISK